MWFFSVITKSFLCFMCKAVYCLASKKENTSCLFLGSSLSSGCASIHRWHSPAGSRPRVVHRDSSPLGPSLCPTSLLSVAITSWDQERNSLMSFSIHLIAFCLGLQSTQDNASHYTPKNLYTIYTYYLSIHRINHNFSKVCVHQGL